MIGGRKSGDWSDTRRSANGCKGVTVALRDTRGRAKSRKNAFHKFKGKKKGLDKIRGGNRGWAASIYWAPFQPGNPGKAKRWCGISFWSWL